MQNWMMMRKLKWSKFESKSGAIHLDFMNWFLITNFRMKLFLQLRNLMMFNRNLKWSISCLTLNKLQRFYLELIQEFSRSTHLIIVWKPWVLIFKQLIQDQKSINYCLITVFELGRKIETLDPKSKTSLRSPNFQKKTILKVLNSNH